MNTQSRLLQSLMLCSLALMALGLSLGQVTAASPDSTFTDADWSSMGGIPGTDRGVDAIVADSAGNLYIGGDFTIIGDMIAYGIAKWDGTNWSNLGTVMGTIISALAVIGSDVYAGGLIKTSDGFAAQIAKWDG